MTTALVAPGNVIIVPVDANSDGSIPFNYLAQTAFNPGDMVDLDSVDYAFGSLAILLAAIRRASSPLFLGDCIGYLLFV
jgi:hypothetical protein